MPILSFPGDKSIAHRLVLISLLLNKDIRISNIPAGQDVLTSLSIIKQLGIKVETISDSSLMIYGKNKPVCKVSDNKDEGPIVLDCKNSGTTARLLCGILANKSGYFKLIGDESLSKRPMDRVVKPLADYMGIDIKSTNGRLPVLIKANGVSKSTVFNNITGSAQVKSAILFAGMAASGKTSVIEKIQSRDHTERLIKYFQKNNSKELLEFTIPGDASSAAYFIVLSAITGKKVCIKNILLNSTRIGFINVLKRMGTSFKTHIISENWEPVGDLIVEGGNLISTDIFAEEIPGVIDELPILAIAMALAKGKSTVSGASELRVKESDRISCLISQLMKTGINCEEYSDGYSITGCNSIISSELDSFNDHRLAMSFAVLAKATNQNLNIKNKDCVNISFPDFWKMLSDF